MPEPVPRTHTDHRDVRTQHGEDLLRYRPFAAVVTDLQDIDIHKRPLVDQALEHVRLRVACEQHRSLTAFDEHHEACRIL